jgi:hypothetical protein
MINCEYYVPAWEGSKTSGKQPDFCLKYKVPLNGYCIKNCEVQTKLVSEGKDNEGIINKI